MILFGKEDIEGILEELEKTSGTNDKVALLKQHKGNESLRAYLDVGLNPYRVYHIKKLPTKSVTGINQATIKDVYSLGGLAKFLESKRGLRSEDLDVVYYYFDGLHTDLMKKWAERAILKKSIAGIGVKTVNKAFEEEFIPTHDVMLMSEWKEAVEKIKYPIGLQRKLDGFRCTFIPGIGFTSRKGLPIANRNLPAHFNMGDVISATPKLCNTINCVFDGEAYSHLRNFNEIASILSTVDKPIPPDIKYHVFNVIPLDVWNKKQDPGSYIDQMQFFSYLENEGIGMNMEFIHTYICEEVVSLKTLYQQFLDEGFEGAIGRNLQFSYAWKRLTAKSNTIFKLKPFDHIDAKILGCYEWDGEYETYFAEAIKAGTYYKDNLPKMLGGFEIELEDETKLKVGSGFKERERIAYWNRREELVGEWIRLKYTEKTPDGSLRFPVFDAIRDAKE